MAPRVVISDYPSGSGRRVVSGPLTAAEIRARLSHPVVDSDGHMLEHMPVFRQFLGEVAGPDMVQRHVQRELDGRSRWNSYTAEKRRYHRVGRPPFWGIPAANTLDRATSMLPRLMMDRLDEFGFDFSIVYPTLGLTMIDEPDEELRRALCRAHNTMTAEIFGPYRERLTPAALIPTVTPEEAIEELDYAVTTLGLKVVMIASLVRRELPARVDGSHCTEDPAYWLDNLALDSEYDYDPFWSKCVELGVAPTAHSFMQGHGVRRSVSNYMYNQIGHFADAGEAFAKALFFGGVTRRFPDLNFGVLEGGVGWAASLYASLVEVWQKRGGSNIENLKPTNIDVSMLEQLFDRYGTQRFTGTLGESDGLSFGADTADVSVGLVDDFAACGIESADDIAGLYADRLYFGCEADDPMTPIAFGRALPFQARLKAMFGSDIGHWDVPYMNDVLPEAFELVEDGLITDDNFREFVFGHAVRLHGEMNPEFFRGTAVEQEAAVELARTAQSQ